MLTVELQKKSGGAWVWNRPKRRRFSIPQSWDDLGNNRRRLRWWKVAIACGANAPVVFLRKQVPRSWWPHLKPDDVAAMTMNMDWLKASGTCETLPFTSFVVWGTRYYLPAAKGGNISCLEYPIADDYYKACFTDPTKVRLLVATLCREANPDKQARVSQGDVRVPLQSRAEVERRAQRMGNAIPNEVAAWALMYMSGLKQYIHKLYGAYLFDHEDEDEADEEDDNLLLLQGQSNGPNFGWWGVYQQVAESGVFGPLKEVYQSNFHTVCIYLVRMTQQQKNSRPAQPKIDDHDY